MQNLESLKKIINLKNFTVLSVIILVMLVGINLVNTNILATQGIIVSNTEKQTMTLEKENQVLTIKISEYTKMAGAEVLAKNAGFVRTSNAVIAPNNNTFALR